MTNATHRLLDAVRTFEHGKIVSAREAVALIRDGDTLATTGFVGIGFAENIAVALEQRFLDTAREAPDGVGHPRNLTLVYAAGQGDGKERGLNHLGHDGLVKRVVGGHWGLVPKLQALAVGNQIEAYNLPQGVIAHLFRDIAAGKPGHLSKIGLGTFVDPRHGGGKINPITTEDLVTLMPLGDEEYLFYRTFPIHVGIIRGTTADPDGNITMEREALTLEGLAIAMAAHNSGGIVIAQVERIAERAHPQPAAGEDPRHPGRLRRRGREARVPHADVHRALQPGVLRRDPRADVDDRRRCRCPSARSSPAAPRSSSSPTASSISASACPRAWPTSPPRRRSSISSPSPPSPAWSAASRPAASTSARRPTRRRSSTSRTSSTSTTAAASTSRSSASRRPTARATSTCRSSARGSPAPAASSTSASRAKSVVFVGTFTAGNLVIRVDGGRLAIDSEGNARKFVREVEHRTYSGAQAWKRRQPALYITERCVFALGPDGLELTEVAPGVDIERDILAQMDFKPVIRGTPRPMDAAIFVDAPMGLRARMLAIPLAERFTYAPEQNIFFVNFERLSIRSTQDIEDVRIEIERQLTPLGRKIYAIVNYDNFSLPPELIDAWTDMVQRLVERFYWGVTRYTTSGFLRVKLGDALAQRGVVPHIYESAEEAHEHLRDFGPARRD